MKIIYRIVFILLLLPALSFSSQKGVLLKLNNKEFSSTNLTFTPQVTLYLPADYLKSGKKYPVLYALDGQNLFDKKTSFAGEWQLDENIESLQQQGLLEDIIVVGVHNTARRMYDYTPTLAKTEEFGEMGGDLDKFGRFLTGELKPYIDSHFPVLTDRLHTGIMGSSLGGLSSFYLLGWYPKVFSRAGVISASFWWDKVRVLQDMKKMSFPSDVRIYMDGGWLEGADESSMIRYMSQVHQALKQTGLRDFENIFYYEDPSGIHSETSWAKRGKMPLLFLYGSFDPRVLSIDIDLEPSTLVTGKHSRILWEAQLPHEMKFTLSDPVLTIKPAGSAEFKSNKLIPLKEGKVQLGISVGQYSTTIPLNIFPDIQGTVHREIVAHSEVAVSGISLQVNEMNGSDTNLILPLEMLSDSKAVLALSLKTGTKIKFSLLDKKGRSAYSKSGKLITRTLSFKQNDQFSIDIAEWK